ncbi:MAG TPA: DUF6632 domain-containing protein [Thermoanaerobaculia bacterium]|jgi:hypothetical protein
MTDDNRFKPLRVVLILVGATFMVGLPLLFVVWPSGWSWHTGHSDYPLMIIGVYATLGAFLILAARNPLENLSLIRFTAWSSIVHAAIMTFQSFEGPMNHGHLVGDVPALFIVGFVLLALTPRGAAATAVPARRTA